MISDYAHDLINSIAFWYCVTALFAYLLGTVANRFFLKQPGWLQSDSIRIVRLPRDGDSHRSISAMAPRIQPFPRHPLPNKRWV